MAYVTDTHSLLWYLSEDARLSKKAKSIFDETEAGKTRIIIPIIVLAECMYVMEKERVQMKFRDMISRIENSRNYVIVPADLSIIKIAESLNSLPELHDRMIVATARLLNAELITRDAAIKNSGYVRIIW